ncbi:nicotinamide N-methyltransferase [Molossus molossus]|uniref:Nicotinamide N-methyltransferase n=1 Tax=Molossus molossus TaxID=27622 RepID=A0A7J8ESL1_MOLMO|nr:nicotinamide N-methyltransferase [Molossus molossus]KAF6438390.1 nicotinamide N-methyltransferase [Molossus molossus]
MESGFTSKDTYLSHFNPRDYLEKYYSFGSTQSAENQILRFLLKNLFNIFCVAGVKGDLLIDIGSGPTIYQLLSACESFKTIIATDYTDQNLQELEKWLKKEPGAFDWSSVVSYVCELEGNRAKGQEKEEKLRRAVKQVLKCDVTQSQPLGAVSLPLADCVLSTLCLDAACPDLPAYRAALRNLSSLLKPGGYLVMADVLKSSYYMIGEQRFSSLSLDRAAVEAAVREAGYAIQQLEVVSQRYPSTMAGNEGLFFLVGQKPSRSA